MASVDRVIQSLDESDYKDIYYSNEKFRFHTLPNWRGLGFPALDNISFESAKINGVIGELNINTTQLIARAYQAQDGYIDFAKEVNKKLLEVNSDTKIIDVLGIFELLKFDVISTVKWLLNELKRTKEELEKSEYIK